MAKGGQAGKVGGPLELAWRLFDEGNKLAARREARLVLAGNRGEAEAAQARELLERTGFPRSFVRFVLVAGGLLVLLVLLAILRRPGG